MAALAALAAAVDDWARSGCGRVCEVGEVGVPAEPDDPTDLRAASRDVGLYEGCRGGPAGGEEGWSFP
jgi:hypothetical protein